MSHDRKMSKMGVSHPGILPVVKFSDLTGFVGTSYDPMDKRLLCAFVERWHIETNSFHLPIRELTITLDDVSNLLHLPIIGQFYTYSSLDVVAMIEGYSWASTPLTHMYEQWEMVAMQILDN